MSLGAEHLAQILLEEITTNEPLRQRLAGIIAAGTDALAGTGDVRDAGEHRMVGSSPAMLEVIEAIRRFAVTDAPILIRGESGTGKELAALAVHGRSRYHNGPFMPINCAGIPPTLIASELFGHEKGAFTGAHQRRIGQIEAAAGGTLFLDEVGDLPMELQSHLLRFLEEKTIQRVGGHRSIKVDVRVISATHENLRELIAMDRFRADLFYRLNVLSIALPPLCERGEDIELLSTYFLRKISREVKRSFQGMEPSALEAVRAYSWPGNVRELISIVRRAVIMADGEWISTADLRLGNQIAGSSGDANVDGVPEYRREVERHAGSKQPGPSIAWTRSRRHLEGDVIRDALVTHRHNVSRTARYLGVSRVTLYRHMRKHGIRRKVVD
ncbi:MAG: sigma-54 dependent transcriptional regulator [Alphaproteobacteria bacterium]|nr:sigma-54 dependent transcriptional regulator [Alphaproteobacteria bacterium]